MSNAAAPLVPGVVIAVGTSRYRIEIVSDHHSETARTTVLAFGPRGGIVSMSLQHEDGHVTAANINCKGGWLPATIAS